MAFSAEENNR